MSQGKNKGGPMINDERQSEGDDSQAERFWEGHYRAHERVMNVCGAGERILSSSTSPGRCRQARRWTSAAVKGVTRSSWPGAAGV
jgi:hypothetical protein